MRDLRNDEDLAEMLGERSAALFFFVDWSEYARRGKDICQQAELALGTSPSTCTISWWLADISSIDAVPNPALHKWLTEQEQRQNVRLVQSIAMGNGSIVWTKGGNIVDFEPSSRRLGLEGLIRRTQMFCGGSFAL